MGRELVVAAAGGESLEQVAILSRRYSTNCLVASVESMLVCGRAMKDGLFGGGFGRPLCRQTAAASAGSGDSRERGVTLKL